MKITRFRQGAVVGLLTVCVWGVFGAAAAVAAPEPRNASTHEVRLPDADRIDGKFTVELALDDGWG